MGLLEDRNRSGLQIALPARRTEPPAERPTRDTEATC